MLESTRLAPISCQLGRGDGFDGGLGAHRGKDRGQQVAMRGVENAGPGAAILGLELEREGRSGGRWMVCSHKG